MAVDPKGADLKRYLAEDPGGPVVMLNLLRFQPHGGRESYGKYAAALQDTYLDKYGAEVLYADPDYQQFTHFRTEALTEAVLQATVPVESL